MIDGDKLLLLEGPDDLFVLIHLLQRHQIVCNDPEKPDEFEADTISIEVCGGFDGARETMVAQLKIMAGENRPQWLGIIVDADADPQARWRSFQAALTDAHYAHIPANPDPEGTIIDQPDLPRVGIWLMPDNRVDGSLEDFIRFLVPRDDTLWPHAEDAVRRLPDDPRKFAKKDEQKALIHTWLAWQKEPGRPMGQAIMKKYLDSHSPHALQLIAWIKKLFDV